MRATVTGMATSHGTEVKQLIDETWVDQQVMVDDEHGQIGVRWFDSAAAAEAHVDVCPGWIVRDAGFDRVADGVWLYATRSPV